MKGLCHTCLASNVETQFCIDTGFPICQGCSEGRAAARHMP